MADGRPVPKWAGEYGSLSQKIGNQHALWRGKEEAYMSGKNGNRGLLIVLIALLACVLILGGVLVGVNWGKWFGDANVDGSGAQPTAGALLEIDPDAGEYIAPVVTESPDSGGIAIPGWGSITIPAGQTEVTVDFPNPEANEGKYYLTFQLRLKDTGEVLYQSGLVKPGLHIQKITLSRPLEAGSYTAVIHVQPYKMDANQTPTNNADMETMLIVVNP